MTQDELKEIMKYDKLTGFFFRHNSSKVGSINGAGYQQTKIKKKFYLLHRLAWLYETGSFPKDQIDHVNHDRSDNRWINLRESNQVENMKNRKLYKKNKSGKPGVRWNKKSSKWVANIKVGKKQVYLGGFLELDKVIRACETVEIAHGYYLNHGK